MSPGSQVQPEESDSSQGQRGALHSCMHEFAHAELAEGVGAGGIKTAPGIPIGVNVIL